MPLMLAAALSSACANRPQAQPANRPIRSEAATALNYPRFKQFSGPGEAVKELVEVFDPQIISFGEFHNEVGGDFRSTSLRFGQDILPGLRTSGFTDLVLEFAPDNEAALIELVQLSHGKEVNAQNTPIVFRAAQGEDATGILSIYRNAPKLNLYGCNVDLQAEGIAWTPEKRGQMIGQRARMIADSLLADGRQVITYTGIYHNDIAPYKGDEQVSFGRHFSRKYSYLEIDLIIPEMMGDFPMGELESRHYKPLVPDSGVMVYRESPRKFVFVFARST